MSGRSLAFLAAGLLAGALAVPASAGASFHLVSISEVRPPVDGVDDDEFVELQMYAAGQNFVDPGQLVFFNPSGIPVGGFNLPGDVANGGNQRTVLVGDAGVAAAYAATPDFTTDLIGSMAPGGGAVCFATSGTAPYGEIDCVAWGAFAPTDPNFPSAQVGTPAAAISNDQSLQRSIAAGCPTLLEASDDTNNNAADFFAQGTPNPRPNSVTPTEMPCSGGGTSTAPGNPLSPINPAGNVRRRKCKKKSRSAVGSSPAVAAKKRCKRKKS